jgi:predicted AlkP superfamily pyrophosphatase or phosphodiesterase
MESDVPRLLGKFESGALLRPSADVPNVVDLAQALWTAAGVEVGELTMAARRIRSDIDDPLHLVFVLADGLGMELLEAMPAATFLWSHLEGALNTVFPSTTAVALTTFATATWPAAHGIVGHWMQVPGVGSVTVLSGTTRSEGRPLASGDGGLESLFLRRSMVSEVPRQALALLPAGIAGSAYSAYAAGDPRMGYRSLNEAADLAIQFIEAATGPTYTYLYVSRIDDTVHELGPARLEAVGAVRDLDRVIERLAVAVGERARIVLTADHGHLAVRPAARRVLRGGDEMAAMFRAPPAGDARTVSFHLQPGRLEKFVERFLDQFGAYFCLVTPEEIETLQLLSPGEVEAETKRRLGDVVAISLADDTFEFRQRGARPDPRLAWPSHHSGLTAAEMRVPLLIL